jgi:hypothetical protein
MTVECFVVLPDDGSPVAYNFVSLPRVGEGVTLPGYPAGEGDFSVVSVEHMPRAAGKPSRPTVQMHLKVQPKSTRRGA